MIRLERHCFGGGSCGARTGRRALRMRWWWGSATGDWRGSIRGSIGLAVERLLEPVYAAPTGRASYPLLSLFKAVLLGAWHGLGDPELEAALADRLSFRRFAGLGLDEAVPDHSTLWRFRDQLRRLGLAEGLFAEVNRQ